jgi:hypothetical protein
MASHRSIRYKLSFDAVRIDSTVGIFENLAYTIFIICRYSAGRELLMSIRGQTMSLRIEELAEKIAALDPSEQEILLERVAELNFQRGLEVLSQKDQERLAEKGELDQKADEVMAELEQIREEIAADDYRT